MPAAALVRLSVAFALVTAAALPVQADEPVPRSEFEVTPLPPVGASPAPAPSQADAAVPAPAEGPTGDAATAAAPDGTTGEPSADVATLPEAPPPLEGPLRPKGTLPERVEKAEPGWTRSFSGGLSWNKGDTAVTLSGSRSSVRLGTTISR